MTPTDHNIRKRDVKPSTCNADARFESSPSRIPPLSGRVEPIVLTPIVNPYPQTNVPISSPDRHNTLSIVYTLRTDDDGLRYLIAHKRRPIAHFCSTLLHHTTSNRTAPHQDNQI
jgi:hypothetical protein